MRDNLVADNLLGDGLDLGHDDALDGGRGQRHKGLAVNGHGRGRAVLAGDVEQDLVVGAGHDLAAHLQGLHVVVRAGDGGVVQRDEVICGPKIEFSGMSRSGRGTRQTRHNSHIALHAPTMASMTSLVSGELGSAGEKPPAGGPRGLRLVR